MGVRTSFAWLALISGTTLAGPASSEIRAEPPIPQGWKLDASAWGDLNGDGVADVALVLRRDDPRLRIKNVGLGQAELDTNPRRMLILSNSRGGFSQIGTASYLLPPANSADAPCLADPLEEGGIAIADKVLSVTLHYWLSCGSYGVTVNTFRFRLDPRRFRLIGFDRMEFSRSSGLGEQVSVNFLTNRKSSTPFSIDDSIPKRLKWTRIRQQRYYLDSLRIDACKPVDQSTSLC